MRSRDVFKAACGKNILDENKSVVKVQAEKINRNNLESQEIDSLDMDNPVVDIHQNARLTIVNLTFEDADDPDFLYLADMVKRFQTNDNSMSDTETPGMAITILPKEMTGFFIHGVSGMSILQSSNNKEFDTVSFIFTNDCIHAYAMDLDQIDSDQLESDTYLEDHFGE